MVIRRHTSGIRATIRELAIVLLLRRILFANKVVSDMARKKIREYDSKRLLKSHILRLLGLKLPLNVAQVRQDTNFVQLLEYNPWMKDTKLVVKPDMLFGKRGKHDLVGTAVVYSLALQTIGAKASQ